MLRFLGAFILSVALSSPAAAKTCGRASYYHTGHHTANGERFHPDGFTAAHRSLGFGTILDVMFGHRRTRVRINDRGPFIAGRNLDLSRGAARALGMTNQGVAKVCYEVKEHHHGKHKKRRRKHRH